MAELNNPRHEAFAQNLMRGLTPTQAYVAAGFKKAGAAGNAARLMKTDAVLCRVNELRQAVTATVLQLAITERNERLIALQERWDALREARAALAREDYAAAMKTGVVCRKLRTVGGAKNARVAEEYEINTALIEALNSVEKRAAIETGQEQENLNLTGQISAKSIALSKVMSLEELEALEKKMAAAMEAERTGKVIDAPIDEATKPQASAASEGPGKTGSAVSTSNQRSSPSAPAQPETGIAAGEVVPSVPKVPRSWRD
jgi:phage terminase small subunit